MLKFHLPNGLINLPQSSPTNNILAGSTILNSPKNRKVKNFMTRLKIDIYEKLSFLTFSLNQQKPNACMTCKKTL